MISTLKQRVAARAADESGVAMVVALLALMIVGMLAAVAIATSVQTNGSSRADANRINALEAAEAGLNVALYRLNVLRPDSSHCVGNAVAAPDSYGECYSSSTSLGNGASYTYDTSTPLSAGSTCVGSALSGNTTYAQRCITATGTVNGTSARAQIRSSTYAALPLFPVPGIISLTNITNGNNVSITGIEAANQNITNGNNTPYTSCELAPGGTLTGSGSCTQLNGPIQLNPVPGGTSALPLTSSQCTGPPAGEPAFQGLWCNDDYRITNAVNGTGTPSDSGSGFNWDATNRILSVTHPNATLTLTGGIYNFCELNITKNATINLAPGVQTEIIIDSPDDPGSGCPTTCPPTDSCAASTPGQFTFNNNDTLNNPQGDPLYLQVYVYGWSNYQNTVSFKNNIGFNGLIYAPQSIVDMSHGSSNSDMYGAIVGHSISIANNFTFTWDAAAGNLVSRATGIYWRTWWSKCSTSPTTSDPASGCG